MSAEFWAALIGVLTALGGLLTALSQRLRLQKAKATTDQALLQAQLDKERKEGAERERNAAAGALEFRERLRQEAIAERGILEESIGELAAAVNRNTEVMERTLDVVERFAAPASLTPRPPARRGRQDGSSGVGSIRSR